MGSITVKFATVKLPTLPTTRITALAGCRNPNVISSLILIMIKASFLLDDVEFRVSKAPKIF